ncbi:MAG: RNA 2',3'-cyclic phosphodiesterase [Armatimonadetes bacterium]|nr:RNA 2',3'-cyclic phosphodiesterase [Armatimonadota bacterium]
MRLFFGLPVDEAVRNHVETAQNRLRSVAGKVKWVEAANFHFTLCFIGEAPEAGPVAEAAEGAEEGLLPVSLALRGVGAFPDPRRPRVIWVGLERGGEALAALSRRLSDRLAAALGLPPEPRGFVPHLTIGRVKTPPTDDALARLIDELQGEDFGEFVAATFALYDSTLTPRGPIYRAVRTYGARASGAANAQPGREP